MAQITNLTAAQAAFLNRAEIKAYVAKLNGLDDERVRAAERSVAKTAAHAGLSDAARAFLVREFPALDGTLEAQIAKIVVEEDENGDAFEGGSVTTSGV